MNTTALFTYIDISAVFTYIDIMGTMNARTPALIGRAIKQLRTLQGVTQADLARNAGVSRTWLSQIESGERDNAELAAIVAVLGELGATLTIHYDGAQEA